ncbi:MAG: type II secretion system F family protein, partial [bacterium]|nr:type II secretion system F family protein [bacterium]
MKFNYQARTQGGEVRSGTVDASSRDTALALLQKDGLYITYLEEAEVPFYARSLNIIKPSLRDVVIFSRQMAIMFESRVPLIEALRVIADQKGSSRLKDRILKVSQAVEGGSPLSEALAAHKDVFSSFYVAMVRAGEASGKLNETLGFMADHLEKEYQLRNRIKGALIYPALVLTVVVFVLGLMVFTILPQFEQIFAGTGAELPVLTKTVLGISSFFREEILLVIAGFLLVIAGVIWYGKTPPGNLFYKKLLLKAPIAGPILRSVYLAQISENIATLVSGGVLITGALDITADIMSNPHYKAALKETRDEVKKGTQISEVFGRYEWLFPGMFT